MKEKKLKKRRKLKIALIIIGVAIAVVLIRSQVVSYIDSLPDLSYDLGGGAAAAPAYPDAEFAVISDLHMYDHSLGTTGEAFEAVLKSDRKLLLESEELLDHAIDEILGSPARFVLISGDLTKDGELINHTILSEKLMRLKEAGLGVYVVPGNHDVNNPVAEAYSGSTTTMVENVSEKKFAEIYGQMGYQDAIYRDAGTLSYVAEPVPGLWLLALDQCRHDELDIGSGEIVGGRMSQETADWIAMVLKDAAAQGVAVMAMSHHGIVEHWEGQSRLHPDYLVADYQHIGEFLASHNVRLVFTGHYHAQDIVRGDFGDKYIYDIETGSLITAPCPIRYCTFENGSLTVRSDYIVGELRPGTGFEEEATAFVKETVMIEAYNTLKKYRVSDKDSEYIAEAIGDAFVAHYSGDEDPALQPDFDKSRLGPWGRIILFIQGYVLEGLWNDPSPADNNVVLKFG